MTLLNPTTRLPMTPRERVAHYFPQMRAAELDFLAAWIEYRACRSATGRAIVRLELRAFRRLRDAYRAAVRDFDAERELQRRAA